MQRPRRFCHPLGRLQLKVKTSINTCMSVRDKSDQPNLQLHHGPVERDLDRFIPGRKVRVRISDDIETVAVKGQRSGRWLVLNASCRQIYRSGLTGILRF
jgi:hypothetical protein